MKFLDEIISGLYNATIDEIRIYNPFVVITCMGKIINKVCSFPNGKYFVFLFLFLLFLFSARFMVTGYGVGGDGEGYYAYLPSVIIDNDLDFENQYLSAP